LSANTRYAQWVNQSGLNTIYRSVLIRGGAGIALRGMGQQVFTPSGIRTEVSDEDAEFLATHKQFQEHQKRGVVRIESIARDPDKVAQKMEPDVSKPKTPADVKKDADDAAKKSGLKPEETLQAVTNRGK
jgi:hypothetical protein